jgi:hypothetical protein
MPICDPYDTCGTTKVVEMSIPYCGVKMFASKYYGTASGDFLNGRGAEHSTQWSICDLK